MTSVELGASVESFNDDCAGTGDDGARDDGARADGARDEVRRSPALGVCVVKRGLVAAGRRVAKRLPAMTGDDELR